jgi:hypothetical protein
MVRRHVGGDKASVSPFGNANTRPRLCVFCALTHPTNGGYELTTRQGDKCECKKSGCKHTSEGVSGSVLAPRF